MKRLAVIIAAALILLSVSAQVRAEEYSYGYYEPEDSAEEYSYTYDEQSYDYNEYNEYSEYDDSYQESGSDYSQEDSEETSYEEDQSSEEESSTESSEASEVSETESSVQQSQASKKEESETSKPSLSPVVPSSMASMKIDLDKLKMSTYNLTNVDMFIDIPKDMNILKRGMTADDPALKKLGIKKDEAEEMLLKSDSVIKAFADDFSYDITVSYVKNKNTERIGNLSALTDKQIQQIIDNLLSNKYAKGCAQNRFNNVLFLTVNMEYEDENGSKINGIQQYTVVNDANIIITLQVKDAPITNDMRAMFHSKVMSSVFFENIKEVSAAEPEKNIGNMFLGDIDRRYWLIIGASIIAAAALAGIIIVAIKRKETVALERGISYDQLNRRYDDDDDDIYYDEEDDEPVDEEKQETEEVLYSSKEKAAESKSQGSPAKSSTSEIAIPKNPYTPVGKAEAVAQPAMSVTSEIAKFSIINEQAKKAAEEREKKQAEKDDTIVFAESSPKPKTSITQIGESVLDRQKSKSNADKRSPSDEDANVQETIPQKPVSEYERRFGKNKGQENPAKAAANDSGQQVDPEKKRELSNFEKRFGKVRPAAANAAASDAALAEVKPVGELNIAPMIKARTLRPENDPSKLEGVSHEDYDEKNLAYLDEDVPKTEVQLKIEQPQSRIIPKLDENEKEELSAPGFDIYSHSEVSDEEQPDFSDRDEADEIEDFFDGDTTDEDINTEPEEEPEQSEETDEEDTSEQDKESEQAEETDEEDTPEPDEEESEQSEETDGEDISEPEEEESEQSEETDGEDTSEPEEEESEQIEETDEEDTSEPDEEESEQTEETDEEDTSEPEEEKSEQTEETNGEEISEPEKENSGSADSSAENTDEEKIVFASPEKKDSEQKIATTAEIEINDEDIAEPEFSENNEERDNADDEEDDKKYEKYVNAPDESEELTEHTEPSETELLMSSPEPEKHDPAQIVENDILTVKQLEPKKEPETKPEPAVEESVKLSFFEKIRNRLFDAADTDSIYETEIEYDQDEQKGFFGRLKGKLKQGNVVSETEEDTVQETETGSVDEKTAEAVEEQPVQPEEEVLVNKVPEKIEIDIKKGEDGKIILDPMSAVSGQNIPVKIKDGTAEFKAKEERIAANIAVLDEVVLDAKAEGTGLFGDHAEVIYEKPQDTGKNTAPAADGNDGSGKKNKKGRKKKKKNKKANVNVQSDGTVVNSEAAVAVKTAEEKPEAETTVKAEPEKPEPETTVKAEPEKPETETAVNAEPEKPEPETAVKAEPERPKPETAVKAEPEKPKPETEVKAEPEKPEPETEVKAEPEKPEPETVAKAEPEKPEPETSIKAEPEKPEPETAVKAEPEKPRTETAVTAKPEKPKPETAVKAEPEKPKPETAVKAEPKEPKPETAAKAKVEKAPMPQVKEKDKKTADAKQFNKKSKKQKFNFERDAGILFEHPTKKPVPPVVPKTGYMTIIPSLESVNADEYNKMFEKYLSGESEVPSLIKEAADKPVQPADISIEAADDKIKPEKTVRSKAALHDKPSVLSEDNVEDLFDDDDSDEGGVTLKSLEVKPDEGIGTKLKKSFGKLFTAEDDEE